MNDTTTATAPIGIIHAAGKDYALKFDINALCDLEQAQGSSINKILADLSDPDRVGLNLLRNMLWSGLHNQHPEIDQAKAGDIIVSGGGMVVVFGIVIAALNRDIAPVH